MLSPAAFTLSANAADYKIQKIKEIEITKPAFLFNYINEDTGMFDSYVSSFGPFRDGNIFKVNNISDQIQAESTEVTNSLAGLKWPNEIAEVPNEVFGRHTYTVADGFFGNEKGTGSITIFNTDNDVSFKITKDKGGFSTIE